NQQPLQTSGVINMKAAG
nr:water-soluble peptide [Papaver somniferum]